MRRLFLNSLSPIILFSLAIATHSCSCNRQNLKGKVFKKNNSKDPNAPSSKVTPGSIALTPSVTNLVGDEQRAFQITFQHTGDKPVSIGNYTVQISLKEERKKGKPTTSSSTFSYKDNSGNLKEQPALRKELSHFTNLTTLNKQNFLIDFLLQPTKSVQKLTFTISLFDGGSSSISTEVVWNIPPKELIDQELLDGLTSKTKNEQQVSGANALAPFLERIKKGETLSPYEQHEAACAAAELGDSLTFDILLKNIPGFDINAQNKKGATPLHYVTNKEITEFLINKGANLDIQAGSNTPFHTAIFHHTLYSLKLKDKGASYREAINYMADHGADVNNKRLLDQDKTVSLLIHIALLADSDLEGTKTIISSLLKEGNDINKVTKDGYTPLYFAILGNRDDKLVSWLLSSPDINVNIADNKGSTPLHLAIHNYRKNTVDLLLKKNPNKNLIDDNRRTPLALAQELQAQASAAGSTATHEQREAIKEIVKLLT